jgi:two-component system response regulator
MEGYEPTELERWLLIVDDDDDDVFFIKRVLRDVAPDYRIESESDAMAVLECLEQISCNDDTPGCYPDVIILDHKMPGLSGLDLLQKLKTHPLWKHIPVVMYSGAMTRPDVRKAYDRGANAYVLKPGSLDEFKEAFRNIGAFWMHTNVAPYHPSLPDIGRL